MIPAVLDLIARSDRPTFAGIHQEVRPFEGLVARIPRRLRSAVRKGVQNVVCESLTGGVGGGPVEAIAEADFMDHGRCNDSGLANLDVDAAIPTVNGAGFQVEG